MDYNAPCEKDILHVFAPNRGFLGLGYWTLPVKVWGRAHAVHALIICVV